MAQTAALRGDSAKPVWASLALAGGALMSIPLMLPPIFWGVAAFTPTRAPEVTAIMHELAMLTFVTTDQYYIFMWVAIAFVALIPNTVVYTPFPRWFGYYTAWTALMFEAGAIAFLTRSGPFAWNGLLAFWSPVVTFFAWMIVLAVLLFRAIASQDEVQSAMVALHGLGRPVSRAQARKASPTKREPKGRVWSIGRSRCVGSPASKSHTAGAE